MLHCISSIRRGASPCAAKHQAARALPADLVTGPAANDKNPPAFDAGRYKERNTVERCFAKLKQFRAVATRYDKREFMYQGTVDVASIRIWLRDPVP